MNKIGVILFMTVGLVLAYIILLAAQPAINSIVSSANSTITGTDFESTRNALNAFPLYMWFIPGGIYLIAIVLYVKFGEGAE